MNYIDAVSKLKQLEDNHDVMSIRFNGVSVWPYLRCYLVDQLGYQKARKPTVSNALFIVKNLFAYNPFVIRKKIDVWSYSGVITRKKIGDLYHHHASGVLPYITDSVLNLENPEVSRPHFSKKEIPEKYIISNSWSILFSRGIEYLLRLKNIKIENEDILKLINKECGLSFDYRFRVRLLYAQRLATDLLLFIGNQPKVAVMECPYDQMGYVWSFHNHGIPVIELQHGVINSNHYGYNAEFNGGILSPDVLCLYGEEEYNFMSNRKVPFCPIIKKTGLFILDEADKYFVEDIFSEYRKFYKKIVVVAGQSDCETRLLKFIENVSLETPEILYIYIPRRSCELQCGSSNVQILFNVNIYQYLKWCDIHSTVSSTTCLEAQYFRKPNLFVELNDTAKIYYKHVITEENGSFFVDSETEFVERIKYLCENPTFKYKDLFTKGNFELSKEIISDYLKED